MTTPTASRRPSSGPGSDLGRRPGRIQSILGQGLAGGRDQLAHIVTGLQRVEDICTQSRWPDRSVTMLALIVCGIAGTAGRAHQNEELLEGMALAMAKRGPDGQGVWKDEVVGLAFRRLAIIDLHERSNQPMHFGPLHLIFNGEIYNYRELREELRNFGHQFETEGDAEVLLHAWVQWEEASLDRLNGMFAFALWDDLRGRLWLASDPFCEKPLYYATRGRLLVFGSEIEAILVEQTIGAAADRQALTAYLARGVMPAPDRSFFADIRRLPAAHLLRWENGRVDVKRYWYPGPVEVPPRYEDAVDDLRELLLDSIRLRLRSDVPVGTSLSGGLDSSCIVALSAELVGDHRRHAFTARFPGYERDEWDYARLVAEEAGVIEHHPVEPTADELLADLATLVLDHEEPVASASIYAQWRVMAAAKAAGVVVLLDGQGGDELFGGYAISAGFGARSAGVRATVRELAGGFARASPVARSFAMDFLPGAVRSMIWRHQATPYAGRELVASAALGPPPWPQAWPDRAGPLTRELLTQLFSTSLPQLLRYADRSSMAHGREVRLPFLDRRIAEYALSLPASFIYDGGTTKRILRDVARGSVPARIIERRDKVAFEPPQRRWLETPSALGRIADLILDPTSQVRALGAIDPAVVESDLLHGAWRDPAGIWRVLNAELWLRSLAL